MRLRTIFLIIALTITICSCSSLTAAEIDIISDQHELIVFLENIIDSQEFFNVEVLSRKTFNPLTKQTKLMTHSFYLITLSDGSYYTLSFSNANLNIFKFKDDGIWILNKATDINSYNLFIKGRNIWNVEYKYEESLLDSYQTINNIINSIRINAKYYYKDHLNDKPNSFNCNSALNETVAFKQPDSILEDAIALKQ